MSRTAHFPLIGLLLIGTAGVALLSGCASLAPAGSDLPDGSYRTREQVMQPPTPAEKAVLVSADALLGQAPDSRVRVKGRTFVLDCIGTVSAIFYAVDIDVQADFPRYHGNGVSRLFQSLKARNVLHKDVYPRPGDIIFWDNTYDANGDGDLTDDPRTHAGVVVAVDPDGTIHYVHEHVIKGVVIEAMNLRHPRDYYDSHGKVINNALAMNSGISRKTNPEHWVAGDLWDSFGDILRVRDHFSVADAGTPAAPDAVALSLRPPAP
jgi:hypothetical protein